MKLTFLPIVTGMIVSTALGAHADVTATHPYPGNADADLWVCAGQSNMHGAGLLTKRYKADPHVMMFNMDDRWMPAIPPTHRIFEAGAAPVFRKTMFQKNPALTDKEYDNIIEMNKKKPVGGMGPDWFFAKYLAKHTGRNIGLIPCALGATGMFEWDPASKDQGRNSLYGNMIERIKMVGGKIKGLIWYQGESETGPGMQEPFEKTWLNFVDGIRRDTGIPDLPVIYVQISRYCIDSPDPNYGQAWEAIRDKQRTAAGKRKNLFVVPAIDLPQDDLIHIGTAGHERLGRRMAEVALNQVYKQDNGATAIDYASYEIVPMLDGVPNSMRVHFKGVNGKLQAEGRPNGFVLRSDKPGSDGPMVFRVDLDPKDPAAVIIRYSKPIDKPISLYYGVGLNPYVNIVDSKDMAIPAFGPIEIKP